MPTTGITEEPNLIELVRTRLARSPRQLDMSVWHSAKEYIAHRDFQNKEELEKVVDRLLNEGGLTIDWSKKIKNKGELINAM